MSSVGGFLAAVNVRFFFFLLCFRSKQKKKKKKKKKKRDREASMLLPTCLSQLVFTWAVLSSHCSKLPKVKALDELTHGGSWLTCATT